MAAENVSQFSLAWFCVQVTTEISMTLTLDNTRTNWKMFITSVEAQGVMASQDLATRFVDIFDKKN